MNEINRKKMIRQFDYYLSKLTKFFIFHKLLISPQCFALFCLFLSSELMAVYHPSLPIDEVPVGATLNSPNLHASGDDCKEGGSHGEKNISLGETKNINTVFKALASNSEINSLPAEFSLNKFRKSLGALSHETRQLLLPKAEVLLVHQDDWVRKKAPGLLKALLSGQENDTYKKTFCRIYPMLGHEDEQMRKCVYNYICTQLNALAPGKWRPLLPILLRDTNERVKEYGRLLVHKYWAISGKESKQLMAAVKGRRPLSKVSLPWNVRLEDVENLRSNFAIAKESCGEVQLAYAQLLRDKYPHFPWPESIDSDNLPHIYGQASTLASFLLLDLEHDLQVYEEELMMTTLLEKLQVIAPSRETMAQIKEWFTKGKNGQVLTIFTVVCPDYSYESTCGAIRYTFESLGDGVGLVAKRILEILPDVTGFLKSQNIDIVIKVALADTEVLSESNLKRLGLCADEFLERVKKSGTAFNEASKSLPVEVIMLSELCGGLENWESDFIKYREMLDSEGFGELSLTSGVLEEALKSRERLYKRWFGEAYEENFYRDCLKDQAAEYACVGALVGRTQTDCLIVGVDHPKMLPFYNASKEVQAVPIVYRPPHYE